LSDVARAQLRAALAQELVALLEVWRSNVKLGQSRLLPRIEQLVEQLAHPPVSPEERA
jgi:hypothetical protein